MPVWKRSTGRVLFSDVGQVWEAWVDSSGHTVGFEAVKGTLDRAVP